MKEPFLVDTHTHVQFENYDADREAVLLRAREAGVWMVNVGTNFIYSEKAVKLAHAHAVASSKYQVSSEKENNGFFATVGLHPNDVMDTRTGEHKDRGTQEQKDKKIQEQRGEEFDYAKFKKLAEDPSVVGIGETGLDYFERSKIKDQKSKLLQKEVFIQHIELARQVKKPLIIHCRDAHHDLLPLLREHGKGVGGIMHFFGGAGAWENAYAYLELGFYLSFSGVITFANYAHHEDIKKIPLDRILLETDAPYVAPVPYRGKRNEPSYIIETAKRIAELKGVLPDELARQTTSNARNIFGI